MATTTESPPPVATVLGELVERMRDDLNLVYADRANLADEIDEIQDKITAIREEQAGLEKALTKLDEDIQLRISKIRTLQEVADG